MKKTIFKVLAVVLAVLLLFSAALPAFASATVNIYETKSQIPIIRIRGDGAAIYDKDGKELIQLSNLFTYKDDDDDGDNSELIKSIANVLLPFLIDGIAFGNWDPYYENLQKEISEIFGDVLLDENGEASNGSGIKKEYLERNETSKNVDAKAKKGYYGETDYRFWYDWRLDPWETAEKLNDYITAVMATTGAEKVAIVANCLGTNVAMAYLARYGTDNIHGVAMDASVSSGIDSLSEAISGKFRVDGNGIGRILSDLKFYGVFDIGSFVQTSIDLAQKSGALDAIVGVVFDNLYDKLVEGVTSALTLGTIVSFPDYWASVSVDDFDTAMKYVFGPEGSEKRETYAGLIEKITNYNENVKKRIPDIVREMSEDEDVRLAFISKYGLQLLPISKSSDLVGDTFVSVKNSSFGATTGTIYEPLSDDYIAKQEAKGLGKYISPDKKVDASTCICPDNTWFLKGVTHSDTTDAEVALLMTVATADRQLTIDDFDFGQFVLVEDGKFITMTEENCNTEAWNPVYKEDHPSNLFERLYTFLKTLFKWFSELGKLLGA